jgi:hypothetical protein
MERDVAEQILKIVLSFSGELDHSVSLVEHSSNLAEATTYRRAVGRVLAEILTEILGPIFTQYPELVPKDQLPPGGTSP